MFSLHWLLKDLVTCLWRARKSITHSSSYDDYFKGGHYEWITADKWKSHSKEEAHLNEFTAAAYGSMKGFSEIVQIKEELKYN